MNRLEKLLLWVLLLMAIGLPYLFEHGWAVNPVWLFFAIGLMLAISGAWLVVCGWLSNSWTLVPGVIVRADVIGSDHPKFRGWYPRVKYRYTVQGREYLGSHMSFGAPAQYFKENAQDDIALYQPGRRVVVYVHPRIPALSVLHTGMHAMPFTFLFVGLAIMVVFALLLF